MDNHCRMFASILVVFVSVVSNSWAECEQIYQHEATDLIAWTGEDVELHCGKFDPFVQRHWKRGEEILAVADTVWTCNARIEPVGSSIVLTINNVSLDDKGQYTCLVNTKPIQQLTFNLQVKDSTTCDPPEKLTNGDFKGDSNSSRVDSYKVNDRVHYFCNRGFELVGEATRTCSGPPHGWTPDEPSCEPDNIVRLQKSLAVIENKITSMESKITSLVNKIAIMENTSSVDIRATCNNICRNGFTKVGEQCYFFGTDEKTMPEALSACQSLGSTLAYPKNSEESSRLKDYLSTNFNILNWWISGTDEAKEGTWVWTHDQSPIIFTDWYPGEPNNAGGENCMLSGAPDFRWHDVSCAAWNISFVCQ